MPRPKGFSPERSHSFFKKCHWGIPLQSLIHPQTPLAAQAYARHRHLEHLGNIVEKVKSLWGLTRPTENASSGGKPVPKWNRALGLPVGEFEMRAIWLVAVIGACAALTSCDDDTGPAAQKTVSMPAACPCHTGTAQAKTAVAQTSTRTKLHHHHQHRWHLAARGASPTGNAASDQATSVSADNSVPNTGSGNTNGPQVTPQPSTPATDQNAQASTHNATPALTGGGTGPRVQHPRETENSYADNTSGDHYRRSWQRHHPKIWSDRYASNWDRRYARKEFSESVLAPYNYVSRSRVTYSESEAGFENGGYTRIRAFHDTIPATMSGARLDPWHGYDVDCPWQYR